MRKNLANQAKQAGREDLGCFPPQIKVPPGRFPRLWRSHLVRLVSLEPSLNDHSLSLADLHGVGHRAVSDREANTGPLRRQRQLDWLL